MIYSGQEVGEPATGRQGFGGDPRTSIFDYCGVPEHQKWMNNGRFDGKKLSEDQKNLRSFYNKLLNVVANNEALSSGQFYELMLSNENQPGFDQGMYFYTRYTDKQRVLIVANFNRYDKNLVVKFAEDLLTMVNVSGSVTFTDLLNENIYYTSNINNGLDLMVPASSALLLAF